MKKIIAIFNLVFVFSFIIASETTYKNHIIPLSQSYIDGSQLNIQEGDTILIEAGSRVSLKLINFHGSPSKYIVFKNYGGAVVIKNNTMPYGIAINNSSYFRFTGTGSPEIKYGIKVLETKIGASGLGVGDMSTNFEIDHIEIANTGFAGIFSKTDPVCDLSKNLGNFTQYQSIYHDNYIHNTGGEGMYIGHSFYTGWTTTCNDLSTVLYPSELKGVRIYNNVVDSAGWDGIQVGCATEDCEIYGNKVSNYGFKCVYGQHTGIQIGGGTTGKCYNNKILNGSGSGIAVFGLGNNEIYNNLILNAGYNYYSNDSTKRVYGIFCDDRSTIPGSSFNFYNNTIIQPKTDGIRMMSVLSKNNKFYNNIVIHPGSLLSYKNTPSQSPFINIGSKNGVDAILSNNYFDNNARNILFADTVNEDFSLLEGSPAIDAGLDLTSKGINYDIDLMMRPSGSGFDIGAYEFQKKVYANHFIYPNQLSIDAENLNIQPGDTVSILSSTKKYMRLINFHGSPSNYIHIRNYGGPVVIKNNDLYYGIKIANSSYFRFTGTGNEEIQYGIKVTGTNTNANGVSVDDGCSNFEVDHLEVTNTGSAGIMSKTNPRCDLTTNRETFTQLQSIFHDNYIHNVRGEGLTLGHMNYFGLNTTCNGQSTILYPSLLKGVRVYNNIIDSTYFDGIRVFSATEDCEVYGNKVTNYGLTIGVVAKNGIQIGLGSTGKCYNNYIANGAGNGIGLFGLGGIDVYNNIIVNAGYNFLPSDSIKKASGFYCDDKSSIPGRSVNFYNNTIVNPKSDGILFASNLTKNNKIYNNIIVKPGALLSYSRLPKQNPYINLGTKNGIEAILSNNFLDKDMSTILFVDTLNNDYRILSNSPAVDNGLDLTEYGITFDFDYNIRPSGNRFDIGAYQFVSNSSPFKVSRTKNESKKSTEIINNYATINNQQKCSILPNPSNGGFKLFNQSNTNIDVEIYDLQGKTVYKENNISVEEKHFQLNLPNGMYIVKLISEKKSISKTLIINK